MRRRRRYFQKKGLLTVVLLLTAAAAALLITEKQLAPVLCAAAQTQVEQKATRLLFDAAREVLLADGGGSYAELIELTCNEAGEIIFLAPRTAQINLLISEITLRAEEKIAALSAEDIRLPLGVLTGSALLSSYGPELALAARPIGTVRSQLTEEFSAAGVNQTRHKLHLRLTASLRLLVPFADATFEVSDTVLLTEGVIVGRVPYLLIE